MFKAHDIRAKVDSLTDSVKGKLYRSVSAYIKNSLNCKAAVICRDARLAAPELAEGLSNALLDCGIDVYLNPLPVSTCQFYYSCMQFRDCAGLMVTASHNPGNYIGIKIVGPGLEPVSYSSGKDGGLKKIREYYNSDIVPVSSSKGQLRIINFLDDYINYSMKLAGVKENSLSEMKVLLEFFGGSAGTELALAFQKAGAQIVCNNIIPDGYFRQGDPNPIIESSVAPTRRLMASEHYDMGFCFDGDGDRMDLMYSDGSQVIPGLNMSVLAPYILKIYGGTKTGFYADAKSNPVSISQLAKSGCKVSIIKNGHSAIKAKLRENPAYFGSVEESAHYYINLPYDINDFSKGLVPTESSLFFALLSARCMKENPDAYQNLKKIQNSVFRVREWALHCDKNPQIMKEIVQKVSSRMKSLGALIISEMDDGTDLEAAIMRFNLPQTITEDTDLKVWSQIAQRISGSEDGVVRWEISASDQKVCDELNHEIRLITDSYVKTGLARY